jgi:hypothetical protein
MKNEDSDTYSGEDTIKSTTLDVDTTGYRKHLILS